MFLINRLLIAIKILWSAFLKIKSSPRGTAFVIGSSLLVLSQQYRFFKNEIIAIRLFAFNLVFCEIKMR